MESFFDILAVPASYALDIKALEQAYFAAQRATHPDRFVGKSEAERMVAITRSQLVNDAYDTLKNPLTRAEHLLELQGMFVLANEANAKVPPALLMEMMDMRERLADAGHDGAALAAMVSEIKTLAAANDKTLSEAFAAADYATAAAETVRLQYLGKAMEEAHMLIYRLKAAHG
jgi:molecular chaperone HscB